MTAIGTTATIEAMANVWERLWLIYGEWDYLVYCLCVGCSPPIISSINAQFALYIE